MKHRQRWHSILSAVTASALLLGGTLAFAAESITVVSWGGAYTRSQVKAHERINRLVRRFENIHKPLVRANLELVTGILILVR